MEATQVFTSKNKIQHQIGWLGTPIQPHQAIVYTKSAAGTFDVPINLKAPLRSDYIPNQGYIFDINQVINNCHLYQDNALPSTQEGLIRRVQGLLYPFQVQTKTYQLDAEISTSSTFFVLNGLLKNRLFIQENHNFFSLSDGTQKRFISTAPSEKITDINSNEYLYFLLNYQQLPESVEVHVLAIFEDSSKSPETFILSEITGLSECDLILLNVSAQNVLSNVNSSEPVQEYVITLRANNVIISEAKTYIIDPQTQEQTCNLLYRNQLGVFETARFTAERDEYIEFSVDSFEANNQSIDYYSESVTKLNLRTGYLQKDWLRHLIEEITASKEIYWLRGKDRIRLAHTGKNLKIYDAKTIQESATFEFKITQTDIHQ